MRTALKRPAIRIGLALLLAVILTGAAIGAYSQVTAFSYTDLLAALRSRGATVQESGTASTLTFQGTGHGLGVNGAEVAAYEYSTTLAAQLDAARVSSDGATFRGGFGPFGGRAVTVDWIAPPHHYRKGRVIVSYIGSDVALLQLLTSVLGPQFAGGGAVPTGNSYLWFVERLRAAGATVDVVQHRPGTSVIGGMQPTVVGHEITVNGTVVSVFEFTDDQAAAVYASHMSGGDYVDPVHHQHIIVEYAAPPHFFRKFKVIVVYLGTDTQVMQLLSSVLGPPFTEESF
jgi:hypothetical protein